MKNFELKSGKKKDTQIIEKEFKVVTIESNKKIREIADFNRLKITFGHGEIAGYGNPQFQWVTLKGSKGDIADFEAYFNAP